MIWYNFKCCNKKVKFLCISTLRRCQLWQNAVFAERALFSDRTFPIPIVRQTEHGSLISVGLKLL